MYYRTEQRTLNMIKHGLPCLEGCFRDPGGLMASISHFAVFLISIAQNAIVFRDMHLEYAYY